MARNSTRKQLKTEEEGKTTFRYQINFDAPMAELLKELQAAYPAYRASSVTTADVIRDALGFLHWVLNEKKQGRQLALVEANGQATRVALPFFG